MKLAGIPTMKSLKKIITKGKRKPTTKKVVPVSVKKYVNKVVNKNTEIKQSSFFYTNDQPILVGNITDPLDYYNEAVAVAPLYLQQGDQEGQRTGNSITLKGLTIKGALYEATNLSASAFGIAGPVIVDVYLGYRKDFNIFDDQISGFFRTGSSVFNPTGSTKDLLYSVNDELYKVLQKKRFRLGLSQYAPQPASGNTVANFPGYNQHRTFKFSLTKLLRNKKIYYQDGSTIPTNAFIRALTMWCTVINPTTGTPFPANGYPANNSSIGININLVSTAYYTDA